MLDALHYVHESTGKGTVSEIAGRILVRLEEYLANWQTDLGERESEVSGRNNM